MATSDDQIKNQHDLVDPNQAGEKISQETPEDEGDADIEGTEKAQDLDKIHEEAFGDEDNLTIKKEVNKDEIAIAKKAK